MTNEMLNQFQFPPEAQEFIAGQLSQKVLSNSGGGRAIEFESAGHDKGMAYRFFVHQEKNQIKSEQFEMDIPDSIDMIEWIRDRDHKPTERVKLLPPQLLKFNKAGECVSGAYKEAYLAWKNGLSAPGLSLGRWEKASQADVFTLSSQGIFTVQQFASLPRDRVIGRFPESLVKLFEEAIHYVNAQNPKVDIEAYANELLALKQERSKLTDKLEALTKTVEELSSQQAAPKRRGRPKKLVEISEE